MKLLRTDLKLVGEGGGQYRLEDPLTGAVHSFSEMEYFVLQSISKPYNETVLAVKCSSQFGSSYSRGDLQAFLERLEDSGLIQGSEPDPVVVAKAAPAVAQGQDTQNERAVTGGQDGAGETQDSPGTTAAPSDVSGRFESAREWLRSHRKYLYWAVLLLVLFAPYSFEASGPAEVLPIARYEMYAEMPGVVEEVFFKGGEWVEEGTPIARMTSHRQNKDVQTSLSAIEKTRQDIQELLTTPSKEEIELAQQQLNTARLQLKYSAENLKRAEELYANKNISLDEYEDSKEEFDVNEGVVAEKQANLAAVKSQINPHQIEAARAEEQRLLQELAYYEEQLKRTNLRMPRDGRIITMNLENLLNKYIEDGELFAEIEDARTARVEIAVPEADIAEVELGAEVSLRIWGYPDESFTGVVSEIFPTAEQTEYGRVVKVVSIIENDRQLLRSGMTGYAKISGSSMFLVTAYTRSIVSFFVIEVWSWLP
jgi:putative peptide zinc metalloprotease protein